MTTELEKLCYPIFERLCNYWHLSCITNMVDKKKFLEEILLLLKEAETKSQKDASLEKEFAWIEKPLVFFIDYMVKEGRFLFKDEWWELARNYQELSGDEKFFDLLNETLENPDFEKSVILFYIMLGLGFDGIYRYNVKYIEQCMRLCMAKAVTDFDIYTEPLLPSVKKKPFFALEKKFTIKTAIAACAIFMVLSFFINMIAFGVNTASYRALLKRTSNDAIPRTVYTQTETDFLLQDTVIQEEVIPEIIPQQPFGEPPRQIIHDTFPEQGGY